MLNLSVPYFLICTLGRTEANLQEVSRAWSMVGGWWAEMWYMTDRLILSLQAHGGGSWDRGLAVWSLRRRCRGQGWVPQEAIPHILLALWAVAW